MAKFRIYNVQLLPKTVAESDVGISGYKRLFAKLRETTTLARRSRNLPKFHVRQGRDAYFGPYDFHVKSGYIWGNFVRYTRTDKVDDLHTEKRLFKEQDGNVGVSTVKKILFIFDCRQHFLAIEEAGNSLPGPKDFVQVLTHFLSPISTKEFPNNKLHVILMSDTKSLDAVFENATAYSRIEVDLTFANGPTEDTLEEVQEARLQKLFIVGSGGADGRISKNLPKFLVDLIKGSLRFGKSKISYFVDTVGIKSGTKKLIYSTEASPLTFEKRKSSNETDEDFADRCVKEIATEVEKIGARKDPEMKGK